MQQLLDLMAGILEKGAKKGDRTGTGTTSYPGAGLRYDISHQQVLAPTTKKHHFKTGLVEEQWMLAGDTDVRFLKANGCNIWDEWVDKDKATFKPRDLASMEREYKRNHFGWGKVTIEKTAPAGAVLVTEQPTFHIYEVNDGFMERHVVVRLYVDGQYDSDWYNPASLVWLQFYSALGISDQEIVSGPLGAVYGKMFRDIDDYRVCRDDGIELPALKKRGFEMVDELARGGLLVHRRIDQVATLLKHLEDGDFDSRRLILCPWNPVYLDEQALPPCHSFIQFWTRELPLRKRLHVYKERQRQIALDNRRDLELNPGLESVYAETIVLDEALYTDESGFIIDEKLEPLLDELNVPKRGLTCILYQRSADVFIGVPYNLSFYSILTHKLANQFNMAGEELVHVMGDAHIYDNHREQVAEQLTREPKKLPRVRFLKPIGTSILDMTWEDVEIVGYNSHPAIVAPIAV